MHTKHFVQHQASRLISCQARSLGYESIVVCIPHKADFIFQTKNLSIAVNTVYKYYMRKHFWDQLNLQQSPWLALNTKLICMFGNDYPNSAFSFNIYFQLYVLHEKYPYSELFWCPFSCIRTEYGEILISGIRRDTYLINARIFWVCNLNQLHNI